MGDADALNSLGVEAEYLKDCNIPVLVNEMMMHLLRARPDDPVGSLKEFLDSVDRKGYGPGKGPKAAATGGGAAAAAPTANGGGDAAPAADADADADDDPAEDLVHIDQKDGDVNEQVAAKLKEGVKKFDLSKNQITALPAALKDNQEVTALSVEENQCATMDDIATLSNLEYLNISDNPPFKDIPEGFAAKLPKLRKIDAYNCAFTGQLSAEVAKFPSLTYLNFYNNGILRPPEGIGQMASLTELNLSSNKIMAIPPGSFDGLKKLKRLALFWNRILRIPPLTPLTSLKELQLNGNQLPEMMELGVHDALEEINLSENKLEKLHPSLFNQTNLAAFVAGKNLLTNETILTGWAQLKALKKIQVPNNKLTAVPAEFLALPLLQVLELNGNQIEALPEEMAKFEKKESPLQCLFLVDNPIKHLPAQMAEMQSIKRLAVKGCPLDLDHEATKATYDTLEAIIKAKGIDGKFIDGKRGGAKPAQQVSSSPATLGVAPAPAGAAKRKD